MLTGNIPKEKVISEVVKIYLTLEVETTEISRDQILAALDKLIDMILESEDTVCYSVLKTSI